MRVPVCLSVAILLRLIPLLFLILPLANAQVVANSISGGTGDPNCTLRDAIKLVNQRIPHGDSITSFLPYSAASRMIFSSAVFGSFEPLTGGPQIATNFGSPFGLPKAACPRPKDTDPRCVGAFNNVPDE
jgi:hypothetical protein